MTALRISDGVDARDVDGEIVVWDGTTLHLLDTVAAEVWRRIDGSTSTEEVVVALAGRFAVEPGRIDADVRDVVVYLAARGLLADDEAP